jgi:hypothetical protein
LDGIVSAICDCGGGWNNDGGRRDWWELSGNNNAATIKIWGVEGIRRDSQVSSVSVTEWSPATGAIS